MPVGAIAAIGGGLLQANAAKKAAGAQTAAANNQIELQREMWQQTRDDLSPWRTGGNTAQQALLYELGLGLAPTIDGGAYGGFTKTPGYDYRLQQGQNAIEASAAARGGLNSGATMQALQENGQNFASNEYGNYLARLGGLSDAGMGAAGATANANANAASGISNALGSIGNAQAAGAIGQGNAWGNALGNVYGVTNYQRQLTGNAGNQINGNGSGWNFLFGGGSGLGGFV